MYSYKIPSCVTSCTFAVTTNALLYISVTRFQTSAAAVATLIDFCIARSSHQARVLTLGFFPHHSTFRGFSAIARHPPSSPVNAVLSSAALFAQFRTPSSSRMIAKLFTSRSSKDS